MESIRSPSGVHQESIRSLSGVHQEYQDFIRTPDGLHQDSWGSVTYSVSASATRKSRRAFLVSLSSDINYKKLQLLLYAAKVSKEVLEPTFADWCPGWRPLGGIPTTMGDMGI